jgi:hypothetical protein
MNVLSEYLPGSYVSGRWDHVNNRLYLLKDSLVEVFDPISSFPITIPFDEPLKDFHLVFNKK